MKKIGLFVFLFFVGGTVLWAQEEDNIYFTDFYISAGFRHQPYTSLNQHLENADYQTFSEHVGILGAGISYVGMSGLGIYAESEFNLNRKNFSNDNVSFRYLPIHVTVGVQYHFINSLTKDWRIYPKLGVFYGTTSLDLIANDIEKDFNQNLMGGMNTSFLYQKNYGLNLSINADKILGAMLKPTTQVGVYSRMGLQVGYILNVFTSHTKLRRNFNPDIRKDLNITNAPEFDPSAFYVKLNFALGKFQKKKDD